MNLDPLPDMDAQNVRLSRLIVASWPFPESECGEPVFGHEVSRPFVYTSGEMRQVTDRLGCANSINDSGQATGFAYFGANTMPDAFLYKNGVLKSIGALPGYSNQPYTSGYGINNAGR